MNSERVTEHRRPEPPEDPVVTPDREEAEVDGVESLEDLFGEGEDPAAFSG